MNVNMPNWGYDMRAGQQSDMRLQVHLPRVSWGMKNKLLTFCNDKMQTKQKTEQKIIYN